MTGVDGGAGRCVEEAHAVKVVRARLRWVCLST
jgi:hypothetical protein